MYVWHNLTHKHIHTYQMRAIFLLCYGFLPASCFQSNLVSVTQMQIAHICTHFALIHNVSHTIFQSTYYLLKMFSRFLPLFSHFCFVILLNCPHSLSILSSSIHSPSCIDSVLVVHILNFITVYHGIITYI